MNSVYSVAFLLVSVVVFAAGLDNTPLTKVLLSLKSTRDTLSDLLDAQSDLLLIQDYIQNCPAAVEHYFNCLTEHNYNPYATGDAEVCKMARIELDCVDSTFAADTTCPGEQNAIEAFWRVRPSIDSFCPSIGSAATSVGTGFFTVIIMTCVNLFH